MSEWKEVDEEEAERLAVYHEVASGGSPEMQEFVRQASEDEDRWEDAITRGIRNAKVRPRPLPSERMREGPKGLEVLDDDGEWKLRSTLPDDWSPESLRREQPRSEGPGKSG